MADSPTHERPAGGSPQALYRRLRAQTFAEMVGQDAVVETLRNAVRLDRLGHGFLFVGPRGHGQDLHGAHPGQGRQLPRPRAMASRATPARACVAIREGRALDVIELDAASNNKVDDMRELVPRVYTAPSDLRRKVFIIDEVQRIKEGWDVLLKTLEEPPDGVLFIFCTTDPSQIRPGRRLAGCSASRSGRCPARQIEGKLRRILEAEGRTRRPTRPSPSSPSLAGGGMRDAESMLDQVLVERGRAHRRRRGRATCWAWPTRRASTRFIDALVGGDALDGIARARRARGRRSRPRRLRRAARGAPARAARRRAAPRPAGGERGAAPRRGLRAASPGIDASRSGLRRLPLAARAGPAGGADVIASDQAGPPSRVHRRRGVRTSAASPDAAARAATLAEPRRPAALGAAGPASRVERRDSAPAGGPSEAAAVPARRPARAARPSRPARREPADDILGRAPSPAWPQDRGRADRAQSRQPAAGRRLPARSRSATASLVLGFPEDQAFMRDIAERKRQRARGRHRGRRSAGPSRYAAWWPTSSSSSPCELPARATSSRRRDASSTASWPDVEDID